MYTVLQAYESYGGSLTGSPSFSYVLQQVGIKKVREYFKTQPALEKALRPGDYMTKPDMMGSYYVYRVYLEINTLE